MSFHIYDFVTHEELESFPDDPRDAFWEFVSASLGRFREKTSSLEEDEKKNWSRIEKLRLGFMTVVLVAAREYGVRDFDGWNAPRVGSFNHSEFQQFLSELDTYIAHGAIARVLRGRRDTVALTAKSKDRISTHIDALRDLIWKADLTDRKRQRLFKLLDDLSAELARKRSSVAVTVRLLMEILVIPGGLWTTGTAAVETATCIMQLFSEAKVEEDELLLLTSPPAFLALAASGDETSSPEAPQSDDKTAL